MGLATELPALTLLITETDIIGVDLTSDGNSRLRNSQLCNSMS